MTHTHTHTLLLRRTRMHTHYYVMIFNLARPALRALFLLLSLSSRLP